MMKLENKEFLDDVTKLRGDMLTLSVNDKEWAQAKNRLLLMLLAMVPQNKAYNDLYERHRSWLKQYVPLYNADQGKTEKLYLEFFYTDCVQYIQVMLLMTLFRCGAVLFCGSVLVNFLQALPIEHWIARLSYFLGM